ncbi:MAG: phosphoadenylyl-sulfate reductase [Planctomycetota bacterium]
MRLVTLDHAPTNTGLADGPMMSPADLATTAAPQPAGGAAPVEGESRPEHLLRWAFERFQGWRLGLTTGFGMEGCVLIDMVAKLGVPTRVLYLDTHFLFEETYQLRDRLLRRYPHLTFINVGTDLTPEQQAEEHGERLWERDPAACCRIRKVEPLITALRDLDVWVTAIRRGQSKARAETRFVEWEWKYELIKLNPLAYWSREQIWEYVQRHDVPYNTLHEQGYPSIGCTHCTKAVPGSTPWSYSRDGRWAGSEKTECGLHVPTPGTTTAAAPQRVEPLTIERNTPANTDEQPRS